MAVNVEIYGRNLTVTDNINEYVTKRAAKLGRYLGDIEEARVDLAYVKTARNGADRQVAQITIRGKKFILRSEERSDDILVAFDRALDKIERQISRYKGKAQKGRGDGKSLGEAVAQAESLPVEETESMPVIARRKSFTLVPMDEMEAIEQMQLLGHESFFIFFNARTSAINVLYLRRDGTYGLIEPEIG